MRTVVSVRIPAVLLLAIGFGHAGTAAASALNVNYQTTNPVSQGNSVVNQISSAINNLGAPGTYIYGDSLQFAPGTLATVFTTPSNKSFNFYDDFLISVPNATVDSITATIDLGSLLSVDNLQVRLYAGTTTILGAPPGGAIDAWSLAYSYGPGISGTVAVLPQTNLGAGNYILEIRGNVNGSFGGSYSGVLNVAPVPLPASLPLLGAALVGTGTIGRRRDLKPAAKR